MKLTASDVERVCKLVADVRGSRAKDGDGWLLLSLDVRDQTLVLLALALLLTHDQTEVLE